VLWNSLGIMIKSSIETGLARCGIDKMSYSSCNTKRDWIQANPKIAEAGRPCYEGTHGRHLWNIFMSHRYIVGVISKRGAIIKGRGIVFFCHTCIDHYRRQHDANLLILILYR
jgi:hypothetical protein